MTRKNVVRAAVVTGVAALAVLGFRAMQPGAHEANKAWAAPAEKTLICHANGNGGFVSINTKSLTDLGATGHFDANGNPAQGHEQDYISTDGNCDCTDGTL